MVRYKKQVFDNGEWKDTEYTYQNIVVIAKSMKEAKSKIEHCLKIVEQGKYRAVQIGDITLCFGLDLREACTDNFHILGI